MAIEVLKAVSHLQEGLKVESTSRGLKIVLDEPVEAGGTNEGMNPVEALLCALGSCQCIVTKSIAKKMRIELEDLKIELEGDLDPAGYQGDKNIRPGLQNIRSKFIIKSNASKEQVEKLINTVEQFCPVEDTLAKGTILTVDFEIK